MGAPSARVARLAAVYAGAICLALLLAEGVFRYRDRPDTNLVAFEELAKPRHPRLGWVLPADARWRDQKSYAGEPIYAVTYTTDARGLRVTPGPETSGRACILFLGGSCTFGTGVEDHETLPARAAAHSGLGALNLGVPGYGPHQLLAGFEIGRVQEAVDCRPRHVVYLSVNDHLARAAGKRSWALAGPRYRLGPDGTPRFTGSFAEHRPPPSPLAAWRERSFLVRRVLGGDPPVDPGDLPLYRALVSALRAQVREAWPEASFTLLHWGRSVGKQLGALEDAGIRVVLYEDLLPGIDEDPLPWVLSPHDNHPNPRSHDAVAQRLGETLLPRAGR